MCSLPGSKCFQGTSQIIFVSPVVVSYLMTYRAERVCSLRACDRVCCAKCVKEKTPIASQRIGVCSCFRTHLIKTKIKKKHSRIFTVEVPKGREEA